MYMILTDQFETKMINKYSIYGQFEIKFGPGQKQQYFEILLKLTFLIKMNCVYNGTQFK